MKLFYPKAGVWACLPVCALLVLTASCKKNSNPETAVVAPQQFLKTDTLRQFLSVTLGVAKDRILYNPDQKEFSVTNTSIHFNAQSIEARYDNANEYKMKYEHK
ncbi:hypothetical protein SAMN05421788_10349 [Filimonas lacunae]|uniref:Uncharacterized protein n=1 Tax=Filimonas lacunae TaxID=477680 RepID=A0A173MJM5_9BACT|nr:hypothetical protein [Filimonas lacunae]BAV07700.1 hypothetical protein FLA_3731 [Filimonas lacunae]SIT03703.1 hypothetical protein SAMN05421788_10349 [Filimonas lacunae]